MIPELEVEGLYLLPYTDAHDAQTVLWLNDPVLQQGFGLARKVTLESHRVWLAENPDCLIWAIMAAGDEHCGNVLLHPSMARASAYLQVYVGSHRCRRKGIASRALSGVLTYAFLSLGLHRIWLHTLPGNEAAEALYAKLGFFREGIEREALPRGGGFVDQSRWSLLDHEWMKKTEGFAR